MKKHFKDDFLYPAPGKRVRIDGAYMHVFTSGHSPKPNEASLVFLSGWGTSSPTLDFKPLWSQLTDRYPIVVVEKFGYGWSDITDQPRDLDTLLAQTRAALEKAGHTPPYVLVPHSLSGLEALYWAQKYPHEVTAIAALDITVPDFADIVKFSFKQRMMFKIVSWMSKLDMGEDGARNAITTRSPSVTAYKSEFLTDEDRDIFTDVFRRRTITPDMMREMKLIQDYIAAVRALPLPTETPLILFSGDFNEAQNQGKNVGEMRGHHMLFASRFARVKHIELECGHYVHAFQPRKIADEITAFISML